MIYKLESSSVVLGIESSSELCSVSLWVDGKINTIHKLLSQTHTEHLLGMLSDLLDSSSLTVGDISHVVAGCGPGSFTGIRIGMGLAQGIATSLGLSAIGVSSLAALAAMSDSKQIVTAMDARMQEIYCAKFKRQSGCLICVEKESVVSPLNFNCPSSTDWHFVGNGVKLIVAENPKIDIKIPNSEWSLYPSSEGILRLLTDFKGHESFVHRHFVPNYVRDKVAERPNK